MSYFKSWQSNLSALIAAGMMASATAPLITLTPANAGIFSQQTTSQTNSYSSVIPRDTVIPVRYDEAEKVLVTKTETTPLTLKVAANIRNRNREILIPAGTQVKGELRPVDGGTRFYASELILDNGRRLSLDAASETVSRTEEINRGINTGTVLKGAAIGAGAAAAISAITGNKRITIGKVLAGAGVGAAGGLILGRNKTEVISVRPNEDLALRLRSDLALRY